MEPLISFLADNRPRFELSMWNEIGKRYAAWHSHGTLEMVYHPRGRGITRIKGYPELPFSPGCTVIYPPHAIHDQRTHTVGVDICLHLSVRNPWPAPLDRPLMIPPGSDPDIERDFIAIHRQSLGANVLMKHRLSLRTEDLLTRLVQQCDMTANSPVDPITEARGFISAQFGSLGSLEEVAGHVGISYHHLRHQFAARFGQNMKQFLTQTRLDYARMLLSHSSMPQKAVARQCGFATERYFCTTFRKNVGITPGEYRKNPMAMK